MTARGETSRPTTRSSSRDKASSRDQPSRDKATPCDQPPRDKALSRDQTSRDKTPSRGSLPRDKASLGRALRQQTLRDKAPPRQQVVGPSPRQRVTPETKRKPQPDDVLKAQPADPPSKKTPLPPPRPPTSKTAAPKTPPGLPGDKAENPGDAKRVLSSKENNTETTSATGSLGAASVTWSPSRDSLYARGSGRKVRTDASSSSPGTQTHPAKQTLQQPAHAGKPVKYVKASRTTLSRTRSQTPTKKAGTAWRCDRPNSLTPSPSCDGSLLLTDTQSASPCSTCSVTSTSPGGKEHTSFTSASDVSYDMKSASQHPPPPPRSVASSDIGVKQTSRVNTARAKPKTLVVSKSGSFPVLKDSNHKSFVVQRVSRQASGSAKGSSDGEKNPTSSKGHRGTSGQGK